MSDDEKDEVNKNLPTVVDGFDDFEEVPDAMSCRSTSAVRKPRVAASAATPAPVMPPPITTAS